MTTNPRTYGVTGMKRLILAAAALAIATSGVGRLSLDALLGLDEPLENDALASTILAGGAIVGLLTLAQREKPPLET